MKTLSIIIAAALIAGCETPQARVTQFHESEYAPYEKSGTGKVTGQAFLKTVGGDVKYAAGNRVWLHPVTSASTEWYEKAIKGGHPLKAGDERMNKYSKMVIADGSGNFTFTAVPAGDYYVVSYVVWGVPNGYFMNQTGGAVHAKIHLAEGETKNVILTAP